MSLACAGVTIIWPSPNTPVVRAPVLAHLFELRTPYPGDTYTINVGRYPIAPRRPSQRATRPVCGRSTTKTPGKSVWVQSSGQVGNPLSPLYASMVPLWQEVKYLPMVAADSGPLLVLAPAR